MVPDLRGFGESESAPGAEPAAFGGEGQARSVLALVEELAAGPAVLAGYDVGSRTARTAAASRPDLVRALVLAPPLPGVGERMLGPSPQREFWYQAFHRLPLAEQLLDGARPAVRAYLEHFWTHWSGPDFVPDPAELDRLADAYARPGAFTASINWYRAGAGTVTMAMQEKPPAPADRIAAPTTVLWPTDNPSTTRCSPGSGPTGWTTGSPTPRCARWTASATSRLWRRPRRSRRLCWNVWPKPMGDGWRCNVSCPRQGSTVGSPLAPDLAGRRTMTPCDATDPTGRMT